MLLNCPKFYEKILEIVNQDEIDYLFHVDVDEYVILNRFENIKDMIESFLPFDQLYLNWGVFGDSFIYDCDNIETLLDLNRYSTRFLNENIKSCINMKTALSSGNAHCFTKFNVENPLIKNIFEQWELNVFPKSEKINRCNIKDASCYLAHFVFISTKNFLDRRYSPSKGHNIKSISGNQKEMNILLLFEKYMNFLYILSFLKVTITLEELSILFIEELKIETQDNCQKFIKIINDIIIFSNCESSNEIININEYIENFIRENYSLYDKHRNITFKTKDVLDNMNFTKYFNEEFIERINSIKYDDNFQQFGLHNIPDDFDPNTYILLNLDLKN